MTMLTWRDFAALFLMRSSIFWLLKWTCDSTSNLDDPSSSHASIDLLDAHINTLLQTSSQQFEEILEPDTKRRRLDTSLQTATKKCIFAVPKTKEEIAEANLGAIPATTPVDDIYFIGLWREWRDHRFTVYGDSMPYWTANSLWTGNKSKQFHLRNPEEKWWRISSKHTPPHCVWNPVAYSNECQQHYWFF